MGRTAATVKLQQHRIHPGLSSRSTHGDDDTDVLIDTVLGTLSEPDTMKRFITSPCAIPDVKSKIVEHLIPSLDDQVKQILDPLKSTVTDLENKLKVRQSVQ